MKNDGVNSISLLFQKVVENDLVKNILQTGIFTAVQILSIDKENKMDIKVLDEDKHKKLLVHLLAKCMATN